MGDASRSADSGEDAVCLSACLVPCGDGRAGVATSRSACAPMDAARQAGQIVRRLERQGFYGVQGLREARWGWGLRAYAYDRRGRPVMLRVNPYSGRVIDLRYV